MNEVETASKPRPFGNIWKPKAETEREENQLYRRVTAIIMLGALRTVKD